MLTLLTQNPVQSIAACIIFILMGNFLMAIDLKTVLRGKRKRLLYDGWAVGRVSDIQPNAGRKPGEPKWLITYRCYINGTGMECKRKVGKRYVKGEAFSLYYQKKEPNNHLTTAECSHWYSPWLFLLGSVLVAEGVLFLLENLVEAIQIASVLK